jgi:glucosamine-6-phosphate deaminase
MNVPVRSFQCGQAQVDVFSSPQLLGAAAAQKAASLIAEAIRRNGTARLIAATGNSQIPFVESLVQQPVPWGAVELFHMDEYAGMSDEHPASFRRWIRTRLAEKVHPKASYYITGDAPDLDGEIKRYTELLAAAPIDLAFVGFGENGHIAFNDPPVADFHDSLLVKRVVLDEACRRQQAGEGHFPDLASVPREAVTVTCPGLFRAHAWICCVPERRKAQAVKNALEGPMGEACPASLVRRHPNVYVYLDTESASLLTDRASAFAS